MAFDDNGLSSSAEHDIFIRLRGQFPACTKALFCLQSRGSSRTGKFAPPSGAEENEEAKTVSDYFPRDGLYVVVAELLAR